jgi:hypothetical protein
MSLSVRWGALNRAAVLYLAVATDDVGVSDIRPSTILNVPAFDLCDLLAVRFPLIPTGARRATVDANACDFSHFFVPPENPKYEPTTADSEPYIIINTALASFMRAGSKITASVDMIIIPKQAHVMRRLFVWYASLSGISSFICVCLRNSFRRRNYNDFAIFVYGPLAAAYFD